MAAGKVTILDRAMIGLQNGVFNVASGTFVLVLTSADQTLGSTFVGSSGQALYSDLTAEITGTGYTAGGAELEGVTVTGSAGTVTVSADPVVWEGATFLAKYGVICQCDEDGDPAQILAVFDLETTDPDGRGSAGGDFIINFGAAVYTAART